MDDAMSDRCGLGTIQGDVDPVKHIGRLGPLNVPRYAFFDPVGSGHI
jgi:hypothetical protein